MRFGFCPSLEQTLFCKGYLLTPETMPQTQPVGQGSKGGALSEPAGGLPLTLILAAADQNWGCPLRASQPGLLCLLNEGRRKPRRPPPCKDVKAK